MVSAKIDLSSLARDQIAELFVHAIADWVCSNWDTHSGNYGIGENGRVIAIDKGQAFKFFNEGSIQSSARGFREPRGFSLVDSVQPRRPELPLYPALKAYLEEKRGTLLVPPANHPHIEAAVMFCSNLVPQTVENCLGDYAALAFRGSESAFYQAVVSRAKRVQRECLPLIDSSILSSTSSGRSSPPRSSIVPPPSSIVLLSSSTVPPPSSPTLTSAPPSSGLAPPSVTATVSTVHPLIASDEHREAFTRKVEALGSLSDFVKQVGATVQENLVEYGLSAPSEFSALSDLERVAIWNYTRQYFRYWNPALRDDAGGYRGRQFCTHEAGIRVCTSALLKLPIHDGPVYRVAANYRTRHNDETVGTVFDWWAFSSTGYNIDYLRSSEFAGAIEWTIRQGHTGRRVDFLSASPREGEVLFVPGTHVEVVARSGDPSRRQLVYIELVER